MKLQGKFKVSEIDPENTRYQRFARIVDEKGEFFCNVNYAHCYTKNLGEKPEVGATGRLSVVYTGSGVWYVFTQE